MRHPFPAAALLLLALASCAPAAPGAVRGPGATGADLYCLAVILAAALIVFVGRWLDSRRHDDDD